MVDILHRVGVAAPPEAVFHALSTVDGIRGWWSSHTQGSAATGDAFQFRRNRFAVVEASPTVVR